MLSAAHTVALSRSKDSFFSMDIRPMPLTLARRQERRQASQRERRAEKRGVPRGEVGRGERRAEGRGVPRGEACRG